MGKLSKELLKGSFILFLSFNIFNFLNLVFNFASARLLGPADYGTLAALIGIIFLFSISNETIQTVVCRYSTTFNVHKNNKKLKGLIDHEIYYFFKLAIVLFLIFAAASFFILQKVFSIDWMLLTLAGIFIFGAFLIPITRGILQGTKKFKGLGLTYITESTVKLVLAITLILLGFGVYGAVIGVILGIMTAFAISFIPLKDILKIKSEKAKIHIRSYMPSLISIASIMIFFTLDILLAKIFFNAELVGYYAAVSNLGKVIFLGTWGIARAMFPLASEKHDKKENPREILEQTFTFVFFASLVVLAVYMFFSKQLISILYGGEYTSVSNLLIYPAFAMALLSVTNVFVLYNLCINKPKRNYMALLGVLIQVLLLCYFHKTLFQFSIVLIFSNMILLFLILLYEPIARFLIALKKS
jgi:O-antigen/teichoic acid export membrane protein